MNEDEGNVFGVEDKGLCTNSETYLIWSLSVKPQKNNHHFWLLQKYEYLSGCC